jgi:L-threonylcarbamoyladenylate synthase
VAAALLEAAGIPIAAPSANRSTELSPTTANHVLRSLDGRIDLILDDGPASGGIESTVLSLAEERPRLLRPGLIAPDRIEAIIGPIERSPARDITGDGNGGKGRPQPLAAPGMLARHYAPRARLEVIAGGEARVRRLLAEGRRVGWLTRSDSAAALAGAPGLVRTLMPADPVGYASRLYAALHALDAAGVAVIVADALPDSDAWLALCDRLRRASTAEPPMGDISVP